MEAQVRTLAGVLGSNIRARRVGLGLKQPQLAETLTRLMGRSWGAATVSRVEDAKRKLSVDELYAMALALGTTWPDLVDPLALGEVSAVVLPGDPVSAGLAREFLLGRSRFRVRYEGDVRFVDRTDLAHQTDAIIAGSVEAGEFYLRGEDR